MWPPYCAEVKDNVIFIKRACNPVYGVKLSAASAKNYCAVLTQSLSKIDASKNELFKLGVSDTLDYPVNEWAAEAQEEARKAFVAWTSSFPKPI